MGILRLKRLFGRLVAPVRRPEPGGSRWASALAGAIDGLQRLNGSTEQDFLRVGGSLIEFRSAVRQISSEMTALIELISGEGGEDRALACMLGDSAQRDTRIHESGMALANVRELSHRILLAFSELRNTVSTFHTLCTLTRIESSRLGVASADFANLANEVKPLSASIETSGQAIFEAYSRLEGSVEAALQRCANLRSRQQQELPPLVAGVTDALGALEERRERAYHTSVRQAEQYQAMGDGIEKLVTSLQMHDITRQQIEHVTEALERLLPQSESPLPRSATPVLALQSHQLWSAGQLFAESVGRIESDLDDIAGRARETAEAGRTLVEASGDERNSFLERMEGYFQAILSAAGGFDREWAEMRIIAGGLEAPIAEMRAGIAEIRRIEIQIQRIAVNAAIGAIHIGSTGQALSVIAEVMQSLAQQSNDHTEIASIALEEMSGALGGVYGGDTCETDDADALGVLRAALSDLHSASHSNYERVQRIAAAGTHLSEAIVALRNGFSAGVVFAEVTERVRAELDRIVEEAFPETTLEHQAAHALEMESLAKKYTMQRERDVHESLVNGRLPEEAAEPEAVLSVTGDDLGENIELF
jgi:hypothetical protein